MSSSKKILQSLFYTLGSGYFARLCSVGLTVVIRRELGRGFFADAILAITVFSLVTSLREWGLPHALLHYQERAREFIGTLFVLNLAITFLVALLACAIALGLKTWWPEEFSSRFAFIVCAFSGLHLLRNLALPAEALLRMNFEFKRLALLHGSGTVLALLSTLVAVWAGWGTWSLVVGGWTTYSVFSLVYVLFFSVAVWFSQPLALESWHFDWEWARRLVSYGGWYGAGWFCQTFFLWYHFLIVWLVAGVGLELYENAWWLVQIPTAFITHVITIYTNALYSRYQEDKAKLGWIFNRMMGFLLRVSAPIALICLLSAEQVIAVIFGGKGGDWQGTAPIVYWFFAYAFVRPLLDDAHGLLWAVGDTRASFKGYAFQAVAALLLILPLGSHWGVKGVALAVGLVTILGAGWLYRQLRPYVRIEWRVVLGPPLIGTLVAGVAGWGCDYGALEAPLKNLILRSAVIGLVYVGCLFLLERKTLIEDMSNIRRILKQNEVG